MALSTYTELRAAIASAAHRTDLTDQIPDFVRLAEAEMNRTLRVSRMLERATLALSGATATLPSDVAAVRSLVLDVNPPRPLGYLVSQDLDNLRDAPTGKPTHYTIEGDEVRVSPATDSAYDATLTYYQALPDLASNSTNWLLTRHPDAYLYGSLVQLGLYTRNGAQTALWAEIYTRTIADIVAEDARAAPRPRSVHRAF